MEKTHSVWDQVRTEHRKNLGDSLQKALEEKGFQTQYAATAEEAAQAVLDLVPEGASVGIPGSVTIRELGVMKRLEARGCKVFHHWDPELTKETRGPRLEDELESDVFLTSSNAITLDGMIVNIDGTGNRVAGIAWTRGKLILVISLNKVCGDLESAIQRVRDTATPPNTQRLNLATPCAKTGYCMDCNSPQRACRAILILERATMGRDSHVILVGENMGF